MRPLVLASASPRREELLRGAGFDFEIVLSQVEEAHDAALTPEQLTLENARRKAYTAMSFKLPTTEYAKRFADGNPTVRQQVTLPNVIAIGGGLPVKLGTEVVGGVGTSGSPGVDEPCVQAGLDKVADQLK